MRYAMALVSTIAALSACAPTPRESAAVQPASPGPASSGLVTLSGTVSYRERIALPPDARVTVRISDVSLMDVAAPVIAETELATGGRQVPIAFSLDYDPARIEARGRYAVSARITDGGGRLIWITDTHVDLPPPGQGVDLLLVRVPG